MPIADQIQDAQEQLNWHWRYSMMPVRFFNLDARAVMPFFVLLIYARLVTLVLCLIITAVFWVVERMGLTLPAALRKFRTLLVGNKRYGLNSIRRRRFREYV
jgi:hypothetical protein